MRIGVGLGLVLALSCAAHAAEPGWSTYTDSTRGFSISYPDGWKVDPAYVDKGYGFFQGDRDDVRNGVAVSPTTDIAPGTNLESDQLALIVERARPADRCVASAFLLDTPPDNVVQTIVNKPEAVQTVADAGDLYTVEHIVMIASQTPCVAVHYTIFASRRGNDSAAKPFDRTAVIGLLNKIASTLTFARK